MELRLRHIINHLYNIFLENDGSENCAQLLEEEVNKMFGTKYLNDDYHTSIFLQLNDYNSILEQSMTLYECLRRCTGICNESRVTCMEEL